MTTTASRRIQWIDAAKGIGIILVVAGHVWRGLDNAGLVIDPTLFERIDDTLYAFHLPLFFFVSGLVFINGYKKRGTSGTLLQSVLTLVPPLIIWSYILVAIRLAAGSLTNSDVTPTDLILAPFPPRDTMWFLWALLLIHFASTALLSRLGNSARLLAFAFALTLALSFMHVALPSLIAPATQYLPFFLLGLVWSAQKNASATTSVALAGLLVSIAALALPAFGIDTPPIIVVVSLLSVCGFAQFASRFLDAGWGAAFLARIGEASLAIFVMHTIITGGTRSGLSRLGIDDLAVHVLAATVLGVCLPLAFHQIAKRLHVLTWLGLAPLKLNGRRHSQAVRHTSETP